MLVLYPRSTIMLSLHLMLMTQLFRYQYAQRPTSPTEAIQQLSENAECELPVKCVTVRIYGICCYDCSGCTDTLCSNHVQCCDKTNFDIYEKLGDGDYGSGDYDDLGGDYGSEDYGDYGSGDYGDYGSGDYGDYGSGDYGDYGSGDYGDRNGDYGDYGGYDDYSGFDVDEIGPGSEPGGGRCERFDRENFTCTKLFMKTNIPRSEPESEPLYYQMIDTCPNDVPQSLKKLCSSKNEGPVTNLIPVLESTCVRNIYRNVHCLKCNNAGKDVRGKPLNLALTRRSQHYYDPFVSLKIESKSDFSAFDIASIQTRDVLILSATPRFSDTKIHLSLCHEDDGRFFAECRNPSINAMYAQACELFDSESITGTGIKVKDTATNQTYLAQNIACAYCALGDRMAIADAASNGTKRCRVENQAEPWMLMNPLLLTDDDDTANGILSVSLNGPNSDMGSCKLGHIYDKVSSTCRKILCPRHHFIYQEKCHPTFTYSVGQSYYIKVRVPVQQDDDDFYKQFGPVVVDAILQKSSLVPCDLKGTFKYDSNNNVKALILEIFFTGANGTLYQHVLDTIKPIFRPNDFKKFTFNGLEYEIYPADDVVFSKDEPGRLMNYDPNDLSELKSKTNLEWRLNTNRHCHKPISLTAMEFCFRMYLSATGVSDQLKTLHEDYKEQIDVDTVAVCIEKYDGDHSDDGTNSGDGDQNNSGEGEDNSGDDGNDQKDDDKPTYTKPKSTSPESEPRDRVNFTVIGIVTGALASLFILLLVCRIKNQDEEEVVEVEEGKNIEQKPGEHKDDIEKASEEKKPEMQKIADKSVNEYVNETTEVNGIPQKH